MKDSAAENRKQNRPDRFEYGLEPILLFLQFVQFMEQFFSKCRADWLQKALFSAGSDSDVCMLLILQQEAAV